MEIRDPGRLFNRFETPGGARFETPGGARLTKLLLTLPADTILPTALTFPTDNGVPPTIFDAWESSSSSKTRENFASLFFVTLNVLYMLLVDSQSAIDCMINNTNRRCEKSRVYTKHPTLPTFPTFFTKRDLMNGNGIKKMSCELKVIETKTNLTHSADFNPSGWFYYAKPSLSNKLEGQT